MKHTVWGKRGAEQQFGICFVLLSAFYWDKLTLSFSRTVPVSSPLMINQLRGVKIRLHPDHSSDSVGLQIFVSLYKENFFSLVSSDTEFPCMGFVYSWGWGTKEQEPSGWVVGDFSPWQARTGAWVFSTATSKQKTPTPNPKAVCHLYFWLPVQEVVVAVCLDRGILGSPLAREGIVKLEGSSQAPHFMESWYFYVI